jgi:mediator of RNA polymerase II transcription subunit 21
MSRSIAYLTSRVNFIQVSDEIPVTKQRNPEKVDPPDVFEGSINSPFPFLPPHVPHTLSLSHGLTPNRTANKKELVDDLMMKAQQIEYLIQSLPIPEPEEVQVRPRACGDLPHGC